MLRVYKFLVIPVLQDVDEDGVVTGEAQPEQPDQVFGISGLMEYANHFEEALKNRAVSTNGSASDRDRRERIAR